MAACSGVDAYVAGIRRLIDSAAGCSLPDSANIEPASKAATKGYNACNLAYACHALGELAAMAPEQQVVAAASLRAALARKQGFKIEKSLAAALNKFEPAAAAKEEAPMKTE